MLDGTLLGVLTKTERAEVRIVRKLHKGRAVIDIRVWWVPDGAADFVPSRKGVTFDETKTPDLIEALARVPSWGHR